MVRAVGALTMSGCLLLMTACSGHADPSVSGEVSADPVSSSGTPSPEASTDAPTAAPTPEDLPGFHANGEAAFRNADGYTYVVRVAWDAGLPREDVAANPPGKTDIQIDDDGYSGMFSNTTEGGRELPALRLPSVTLVGLYDRKSAACSNALTGLVATQNDKVCVLFLTTVMEGARAGGAFDLPSIPNAQEIPFAAEDFISASTAHWQGVDEAKAGSYVDALSSPLALGLVSSNGLVSETKAEPTSRPACTVDDTPVALIDSNFGTSAPGCS